MQTATALCVLVGVLVKGETFAKCKGQQSFQVTLMLLKVLHKPRVLEHRCVCQVFCLLLCLCSQLSCCRPEAGIPSNYVNMLLSMV